MIIKYQDMKKRILILLATAFFAACSTSDDIEPTMPEYGEGRISLGFSASNLVEIGGPSLKSASATVDIPEEFIPTADDFKLTITGRYYDPASETYIDFSQEYESITAYNNMEEDADDPTQFNPPYLVAGEYTAVAEYGEGVNIESATNAHFKGEVSFTIIARENNATANLNVTLQNSIIKLTTTDNFKNYYSGGATLSLSTTQETTITIDTTDADSEEQILFVSPTTSLYLEGKGVKQDPGNGNPPTVTFYKTLIGSTTAMTMTTVEVDADDAGGKFIGVSVNDEYTEINETEVDLH